MYNKVTQLYIYIFFSIFFSSMVYHSILNIVPCGHLIFMFDLSILAWAHSEKNIGIS